MPLIDVLRAKPWLAVVGGLALAGLLGLLMRKPKIQRDADARLSDLRRDSTDQYNKLRRLR